MGMITILTVIVLLEVSFSPRLGFTRENKVLLWYGKRDRKYIVIL